MIHDPHVEVPIKVTALVDEDIAPLVLALNSWEGILTVCSCQGRTDQSAYVYFNHAKGIHSLFSVVKSLANGLSRYIPGKDEPRNGYTLKIEWAEGADGDHALACLSLNPLLIDSVSKLISREIAL